MKKRAKKRVLLAGMVLVMGLCSAAFAATDWIYFSTDSATGDKMFYSPSSVKYSKDVVIVHIKTILSSQSITKLTEQMKSLGEEKLGSRRKAAWENYRLSYIMNPLLIDCKKNTWDSPSTAFLTENNTMMDYVDYDEASMPHGSIKPGSNMDVLFKRLCK